MSANISPVFWRLSTHKNERIQHESGDMTRYTQQLLQSLRLRRAIAKLVSNNHGVNLNINSNSVQVHLKVGGLQDLQGDILSKIKKQIRHLLPQHQLRLDVGFSKKQECSSEAIAVEVANAIIRRKTPVSIVSYYLRLAETTSSIFGLRVELKGRFKASTRKQRVVYKYGNLPLQSISAPIDYFMSEPVGRFGKSSVKVWVYKHG